MRIRLIVSGGLLILAMAGTALAAPSPAASPPLTPEQTRAVEQAVHDYIQRNPEIVIEALDAAKHKAEQEKNEQTQQVLATRRSELIADPTSPVGGNPEGDVTIVEFFDYRCPYCKEVEPSLEALVKQDPKLRIVYKEFPILGPASVYATRVALAAQKQGKYAAFHNAMMATKGQIDETVILGVARLAGLDLDRVKKDIGAPDIDTVIRHNFDLAQALAISGTPGFVVGNEIAEGAADIDALTRMVSNARIPD
jgi:protein-disulfide isomerase